MADPPSRSCLKATTNPKDPGTKQNLRANTAVPRGLPGQGELWFRLFARPRSLYWDTRTVRNGPYRLMVKAWDVAGNRADASVDALVQNP